MILSLLENKSGIWTGGFLGLVMGEFSARKASRNKALCTPTLGFGHKSIVGAYVGRHEKLWGHWYTNTKVRIEKHGFWSAFAEMMLMWCPQRDQNCLFQGPNLGLCH